jgi:hypothetical protein
MTVMEIIKPGVEAVLEHPTIGSVKWAFNVHAAHMWCLTDSDGHVLPADNFVFFDNNWRQIS